jgi:Cof subfamily protein (haloacid dehalogenase superfamily)
MAHSDVTVYVTDLDGTLLDSNAHLSARTRAGLAELLDEGLLLTVASARSVVAMQQMFDGLRLPLPVVEFNGAFISDLATGRHLVTNAIDADVVGDVYRTISSAGFLPFVSTFDGDSDRFYYSETRNAGMKWYLDDRIANHDPRVRRTEDLPSRLSEQVASLTVIDRPELVEKLHWTLADEFGDVLSLVRFDSLYSLGWQWLTVHDALATKDQALVALLRRQGLEGAEVVAFGDSNGDIPLFRVADRSIAVANASTELTSLATEVIGANNEDGVVEFLERDWRA